MCVNCGIGKMFLSLGCLEVIELYGRNTSYSLISYVEYTWLSLYLMYICIKYKGIELLYGIKERLPLFVCLGIE